MMRTLPTPVGRVGQRLVCPNCGRKGVTLRLGREDHFGCRYCDWYAFNDGLDEPDVVNRSALAEMNPEWTDAAWRAYEGGVRYLKVPRMNGMRDSWQCTANHCGAYVVDADREGHTLNFHEHAFIENIDDASMCICGLPDLIHDDQMTRRRDTDRHDR
jgi:hypothetical protein